MLSSFTPANAAIGAARGCRLALDPTGKAAEVFSNGGTGSVVHHCHSLGQSFAHSRRAAQDKRQETVAQLLAKHFADIEVQGKRGIKLIQHIVRKRGLGSRVSIVLEE